MEPGAVSKAECTCVLWPRPSWTNERRKELNGKNMMELWLNMKIKHVFIRTKQSKTKHHEKNIP